MFYVKNLYTYEGKYYMWYIRKKTRNKCFIIVVCQVSIVRIPTWVCFNSFNSYRPHNVRS